jgi:hypothetical protein
MPYMFDNFIFFASKVCTWKARKQYLFPQLKPQKKKKKKVRTRIAK